MKLPRMQRANIEIHSQSEAHIVIIQSAFIRVCVLISEPWHEIFNNLVCATSKGSDQPAHTRSLIRAFASRLNIL